MAAIKSACTHSHNIFINVFFLALDAHRNAFVKRIEYNQKHNYNIIKGYIIYMYVGQREKTISVILL